MMVEQLQQAKLVLLGEMGSGKTSLVQRYVRGHYFENQVSEPWRSSRKAKCALSNMKRPKSIILIAFIISRGVKGCRG